MWRAQDSPTSAVPALVPLSRRGADRERLDPVRRRPRRPRRATVLRASAVVVLLALAAGVLLVGRPVSGGARACRPPLAENAPPPGGPGRTPGLPPGTRGYPLRLTDPGILAVVHPGDLVDVLAPAAGRGLAVVVAAEVAVVRTVVTTGDVGVLYLAVRPEQARLLAGLTDDVPISVTVRPP